MEIEEKIKLIKEVGEEIINEDELRELLQNKEHPIAYDGFEPSGRIHIAQGLLRSINVNKLTKAGIHFKFWVADWFALMNNKMGGDLEKIRTVGEYFIEVWKACGMDLTHVEFLWASENMGQDYWLRVIKIGTLNTVTRITRCSQIMGRNEKDSLSAAQIFYPCMQCSDIFHLDADITQLGMDQRKVNVLAREVAPKLGHKKPVVISHHMLMGLTPPADLGSDVSGADASIAKKMSKSNPDSAIFMTDTFDEIKRKFKKAYCPEGEVKDNPVLEYCKYIIFEKIEEFVIERPEKWGGNMQFNSYADLEAAFVKKELHPMDLKTAAAKYIDSLIDPVRKHFETDEKAKQLLEKVESYIVTR
ncbi:tyrosine--tRNA ligase [Candidatus Woesearchaeota archaeon]|jgi:tyrosyl-tRNA synthetase|nr:tyrosine--tRNA ligase [Candidatus Woesearchaeota archaeon]